MSLRFRGGERLQRGRGIGGLLRLAKSVFSPMIKTIGKTAMKAVNSKAGKMAIEAIKDQAISSGINLTADAIRGNDLQESFQNELGTVRERASDTFENIQSMRNRPAKRKALKQKQVKRGEVKVGYNKYTDNKNNADLFSNIRKTLR
jgi:hypothetical protein